VKRPNLATENVVNDHLSRFWIVCKCFNRFPGVVGMSSGKKRYSVATYGWIGKALGYPRGARMIGWIMNESPNGVPAQRVINSKGELSGSWAFGQSGTMRQLLEAEDIVFSADERVDMKRYGWDPTRDLTEEELRHILDAAAHTPVNASERLVYLMRTDPASPLRGSEHPK
jgi:methylated-DNA-protein-cysteine methyltransferase related protein